MDKSKRKSSSSSNVYYSLSKKKLRNNLSINSLENLSNEIFHEIFDYLYGWEIYCAFSNLNNRFEKLLDSPSILYRIQLIDRFESNEISLYKWIYFMCLNRKQIYSIQLSMLLETNRLLPPMFIDSSFDRLESLCLIEPKQNQVMKILKKLIHLRYFRSLTIEQLDGVKDLTDLYRIIFDLPMLNYVKISLDYFHKPVSLSISTKPSLVLQHLLMNHSCTFNDLSTILSYTPQLHHLSFIESDNNDRNIEMLIPLIPIHLTNLRIHVSHVTFDQFEMFIRQLPTQLKVLMFSTSLEEISYLDAHRWERFLQEDLPELKTFSFGYHERSDGSDQSNIHFREINPFFSSFWLQRRYTFEIQPECEHIIYSIRPYKKRWYEQPNIDNTTIELIKSVRLSISYVSPDEYHELVVRDIEKILSATHVYHLEISEKQIPIDILIQITNALPDVTTMKLHSLSLDQVEHSETEQPLIYPSTISINQITKIYLEKVSKIDEVYALIKHYPMISYLKIDSFDDIMIDLFIQNIFKKINRESNENFRSLCFRLSTTDDFIVQTLEKMKKEKKFINDYTIHRWENYLILQWE